MKKQNGCLTAFLIVFGIIVTVGLIYLGGTYYFLSKKFELKEIKTPESAAMADVSAPSSEEAP